MTALPPGWCNTRFEDVAEIQLGKMLDRAKNQGVPTPYLRNVNVRWGHMDISDVLTMPMSEGERTKFSIKDGDVLVCEGGEPGRAAVWRSGPTDLKYQKALLRLRSISVATPDWLAAYLRFSSQNGTLNSSFTGTTIKHLPREALQAVVLPLPPPAEQRRIVAKIDGFSAKSKRAGDHLAQVIHLVQKYKGAVRTSLMENAGAHDKRRPLAELCERVTKGGSPRWQGFEYQNDGVVFVRSQNVGWGFLDMKEKVYLNEDFNRKMKNSVIMENDVLLNIVGASIGRAAVATQELSGANCNQAVAVLRLKNPDLIDAKFLVQWLLSEEAQARIMDGSVDVARANFSLGSIGRLMVPWPERSEREAIIRLLDTAFVSIHRLASEATSARKLIDHLNQAILSKAFRGELVPQDPNDEPASVLLERIKAERAGLTLARRGRGRPRLATTT